MGSDLVLDQVDAYSDGNRIRGRVVGATMSRGIYLGKVAIARDREFAGLGATSASFLLIPFTHCHTRQITYKVQEYLLLATLESCTNKHMVCNLVFSAYSQSMVFGALVLPPFAQSFMYLAAGRQINLTAP